MTTAVASANKPRMTKREMKDNAKASLSRLSKFFFAFVLAFSLIPSPAFGTLEVGGEEASQPFEFIYKDAEKTVDVKVTNPTGVAPGAELKVGTLTKGKDYQAASDAVDEYAEKQGDTVASQTLYDVYFADETGARVPLTTGEAYVTFKFTNPLKQAPTVGVEDRQSSVLAIDNNKAALLSADLASDHGVALKSAEFVLKKMEPVAFVVLETPEVVVEEVVTEEESSDGVEVEEEVIEGELDEEGQADEDGEETDQEETILGVASEGDNSAKVAVEEVHEYSDLNAYVKRDDVKGNNDLGFKVKTEDGKAIGPFWSKEKGYYYSEDLKDDTDYMFTFKFAETPTVQFVYPQDGSKFLTYDLEPFIVPTPEFIEKGFDITVGDDIYGHASFVLKDADTDDEHYQMQIVFRDVNDDGKPVKDPTGTNLLDLAGLLTFTLSFSGKFDQGKASLGDPDNNWIDGWDFARKPSGIPQLTKDTIRFKDNKVDFTVMVTADQGNVYNLKLKDIPGKTDENGNITSNTLKKLTEGSVKIYLVDADKIKSYEQDGDLLEEGVGKDYTIKSEGVDTNYCFTVTFKTAPGTQEEAGEQVSDEEGAEQALSEDDDEVFSGILENGKAIVMDYSMDVGLAGLSTADGEVTNGKQLLDGFSTEFYDSGAWEGYSHFSFKNTIQLSGNVANGDPIKPDTTSGENDTTTGSDNPENYYIEAYDIGEFNSPNMLKEAAEVGAGFYSNQEKKPEDVTGVPIALYDKTEEKDGKIMGVMKGRYIRWRVQINAKDIDVNGKWFADRLVNGRMKIAINVPIRLTSRNDDGSLKCIYYYGWANGTGEHANKLDINKPTLLNKFDGIGLWADYSNAEKKPIAQDYAVLNSKTADGKYDSFYFQMPERDDATQYWIEYYTEYTTDGGLGGVGTGGELINTCMLATGGMVIFGLGQKKVNNGGLAITKEGTIVKSDTREDGGYISYSAVGRVRGDDFPSNRLNSQLDDQPFTITDNLQVTSGMNLNGSAVSNIPYLEGDDAMTISITEPSAEQIANGDANHDAVELAGAVHPFEYVADMNELNKAREEGKDAYTVIFKDPTVNGTDENAVDQRSDPNSETKTYLSWGQFQIVFSHAWNYPSGTKINIDYKVPLNSKCIKGGTLASYLKDGNLAANQIAFRIGHFGEGFLPKTKKDENGNDVIVKDEAGNIEFEKDKNGYLVRDPNSKVYTEQDDSICYLAGTDGFSKRGVTHEVLDEKTGVITSRSIDYSVKYQPGVGTITKHDSNQTGSAISDPVSYALDKLYFEDYFGLLRQSNTGWYVGEYVNTNPSTQLLTYKHDSFTLEMKDPYDYKDIVMKFVPDVTKDDEFISYNPGKKCERIKIGFGETYLDQTTGEYKRTGLKGMKLVYASDAVKTNYGIADDDTLETVYNKLATAQKAGKSVPAYTLDWQYTVKATDTLNKKIDECGDDQVRMQNQAAMHLAKEGAAPTDLEHMYATSIVGFRNTIVLKRAKNLSTNDGKGITANQLIEYSIVVNKGGKILLKSNQDKLNPSSASFDPSNLDMLTIKDTIQSGLNFKQNVAGVDQAVKVQRLDESGTQPIYQLASDEYSYSYEDKVLTINVPDNQPLLVSYYCTPSAEGSNVSLVNKVEIEGVPNAGDTTENVTSVKKSSSSVSISKDGFTLIKENSNGEGKNSRADGVTFRLYGKYYGNAGDPNDVITVNGKDYVYYTSQTTENGMCTFSTSPGAPIYDDNYYVVVEQESDATKGYKTAEPFVVHYKADSALEYPSIDSDYSKKEHGDQNATLDIQRDGEITVVNKVIKKSLGVEKIWDDGLTLEDHAGDSVEVTLCKRLANEKNASKTNQKITLNADNNWKGEFSNLPGYENTEKDGVQECFYSVEETGVSLSLSDDDSEAVAALKSQGYISNVTSNGDKTRFTITNTLKATDIQVNKVWRDGLQPDALSRGSINIKLTGTIVSGDSAEKVFEDVKPLAAGETSLTFTDLPKYYKDSEGALHQIVYTASDEIDGYLPASAAAPESTNEGVREVTLTNVLATSASVKKVWNDASVNHASDSVKVNLLSKVEGSENSTAKVVTTATLSDGNNWLATFENLPAYNTDNKKLEYFFSEAEVKTEWVGDYESPEIKLNEATVAQSDEITTAEYAYTITNTLKTTLSGSVSIEKHFFSSQSSAFTFSLYNATVPNENGVPTGRATLGELAKVPEGSNPTEPLTVGGAAMSGDRMISLPTITEEGTYWYAIQEDPIEDPNVINDETQYLIRVVAAKEDNNRLVYQTDCWAVYADGTIEEYPAGTTESGQVTPLQFYNNSSASFGALARLGAFFEVKGDRETWVKPDVKKVMEGRGLNAGDFTFVLSEYSFEGETGVQLATGTNDAYGTITFAIPNTSENQKPDSLRFTEPGEYWYVIRENGPDGTKPVGIIYDESEIYMHVVIGEDETGALTSDVAYYMAPNTDASNLIEGQAQFTNKMDSINLVVRKTSKDNPDVEGLFNSVYGLWMVNDGANDVYLGANASDEEGWIVFENIDVMENQRYYFKEEAAPEGHLVDAYRSAMFSIVYDENAKKYKLVYEGTDSYRDREQGGNITGETDGDRYY